MHRRVDTAAWRQRGIRNCLQFCASATLCRFIAEALLQVGFIFSRSELKRNLKLKGDVPKEKAAALRNVAWQKLSLQGLSV